MNSRERFKAWMHFRRVDRPPFYEWLGFWGETVNRWRGEGLPAGVDVFEYFDFDKREHVPLDLGPIPRFIRKTIYENSRYEVYMNQLGIVMRRLKASTSMPCFMEFPVKNSDDWMRLKMRFNPEDPRRLPLTWSEELFKYYEETDRVVSLGITGFFGAARNFMGLERLLKSFYTQPNLVTDIMEFWAGFLVKILKPVLEKVKLDYVTIWEDMCYKKGPLISPRTFEKFMLPYYKQVTKLIKAYGVDLIMVDTDGNHNPINDLFIEGGVNCLYPLEKASGVDCVKLREIYGRKLMMIGNIDKRALAKGSEAIDHEIERVKPLLEEGGYIISVDHAVPSDVPFKNYTYYISRVRKLLGIN